MHCPTCRIDNPTTTRFCTACGAVLIEEAPGGGRRRVLRPWGLRRSAPPTVSPDFPDLAADLAPVPDSAAARAWRIDLSLAGGVVGIVTLVALLHPWHQPAESVGTPRIDERVVTAPATVAAPTTALMMETRLAAPALVERASPQPPKAKAEGAKPAALAEAPAAARLGGPRGLPAVPVTYAMPARELVVGDGESAAQPPQPAPAPASAETADRWQPLRAELDRCRTLGVFEGATCAQSARLTHCESFWGHVPECPAQRLDVR